MNEKYHCENCWRYDLENETRIFWRAGWTTLQPAIEIASIAGYDTIITVIE
jgi:hypothetical protein